MCKETSYMYSYSEIDQVNTKSWVTCEYAVQYEIFVRYSESLVKGGKSTGTVLLQFAG